MKAITFEQFIETFNFRDFNEYAQTEKERYDTKIIRVYLDDTTHNWFEFGVYDFGINTWELVQKSLSKEVCQSYIGGITYDSSTNILKVFLQKESEIFD